MNDYAALTTCFYCGEESGIVIDRRIRKILPRNVGVISMEPCSDCEEHMKDNIILLGIVPPPENENIPIVNGIPNPYRTGDFVVMKQEAADRIFNEEQLKFANKNRFMFVDSEILKVMIHNHEGQDNG